MNSYEEGISFVKMVIDNSEHREGSYQLLADIALVIRSILDELEEQDYRNSTGAEVMQVLENYIVNAALLVASFYSEEAN